MRCLLGSDTRYRHRLVCAVLFLKSLEPAERGLDRTSFYEWKRRFQTQGFEGLKDLPPIHKSHPQTTPEPVVARIRALALEHPAYGCNRLEAMLAPEGTRVSSITIQKILNENGLGARLDRWLALEKANAERAVEITPEQAAFLEKLNPCFRERHVESGAPGELLSADTFFVGNLKGIGKVYLHAVVDTYGSYAFGFLPFYRNLDLNGIEHRRTRVKTPKTNGFVERFNGTVLDEFFRVTMRETFYDTVEALQADLDAWLVHYNNTERLDLGYRNQGRRPVDTVNSFVGQEA